MLENFLNVPISRSFGRSDNAVFQRGSYLLLILITFFLSV
jgi:hypothetical protein